MANRGNSNYRRGSSSGDMDETQVFRPVQNSGRRSQNSGNSGNNYNDGSGYYDGSYDNSNSYGNGGYNQSGYDQSGYNQSGYDQAGYDQASYDQAGYDQAAYDGYDDYDDGYYEDEGYAQPRQTLAARASGRANPDPYDQVQSRPRRERSHGRQEPAYQEPQRSRRRRRKRHPFRKFLIFLLVLAAILAGLYFALFRAPSKYEDGVHTRKSGFYNILLCATDESGLRTDTIMIATIDQKGGSVSLTSIPRDTIVDNGETVPKLNGVYGIAGTGDAGAQSLMDHLKTILGFRPDGYVIIGYEIFRDVVDAMGGVTFDVPMDMTVDNPTTGEDMTLTAGEQVLNGDQALGLCRFRYGYAMADIQRQYVQQTFVKAMVKQCMSVSSLPKLPAIYKAAMSNMITDLDGANLRYLALHALLSGGMSDIAQHTLPGEGVSYNGASCYGLYGQSVVDMVNEVMDPFEEDITIDDVHILTVSDGSLVESTWRGTAFDASTYQYN